MCTATDTVQIDWYHEAELAQRLGYSLFCRVEGIDTDLVVREVRRVGDNDYEVRVLEGWRRPLKCWAVGDGTLKVEDEVKQEGLFK